MRPPKDVSDLMRRYTRAQQDYKDRQQMVLLCREMYKLQQNRTSVFLGGKANEWRTRVPSEYFEANNRPHNAVNLMTAVLAGNEPQYTVTSPGNLFGTAASRAEMFMAGVLRCNSRRQQSDIYWNIVFNTVLDGACGVKVYWDPAPTPPIDVEVLENPDLEAETTAQDADIRALAKPWVVNTYDTKGLPIVMDVVRISNLYPMGRGTVGQPFDQIIHSDKRTPLEVYYEWEHESDADLDFINNLEEQAREETKHPYLEWWGRDNEGHIWHAVSYMRKWIVKPRVTDYPELPYVIFHYQDFEDDNPSYKFLPFLYAIFHPSNKKEYLKSRAFRLIDMYTGLPPVHRGPNPVNIEKTWGAVLNLEEDDILEFPKWSGQPPDVYKHMEDLGTEEEEGTFSQAMYGQFSAGMSGYAMSQAVGADTIRTDTPARNISLGMSKIAEIVFSLMKVFAPDQHLSVTAQVGSRTTSVILAGYETDELITEAHVKPKHIADDVRMASLGAQLASLPNSPVSMYYILEHYFGIAQPEIEVERKMIEDAERDPIIRLMAILQVLKENDSPHSPIIQQQLNQALVQAGMGQQQQAQPQMPQLPGMGLPQATMGNQPMIPPSGNTQEEGLPTQETLMQGGPVPGMRGY